MRVKIVQKENQEPVAAEVIAGAILEISKAMKRLSSTRLTRKAVVALIHDQSKISKGIIEVVLNNLENLEATWLKKKSLN